MVPLVASVWLETVALEGGVEEAPVAEDGGMGGISDPDVVTDADAVADEVADDGGVLVPVLDEPV
jgi:hypothetical protein